MSTRPTHSFINDSTPAGRRDVGENGRLVREAEQRTKATTYATFAEAFADEDRGGRYNTGSNPILTADTPVYPAQPPNSPFHHDPVGPEPPLGIDINPMEPVGTAAEIEASLKEIGEVDRIVGAS